MGRRTRRIAGPLPYPEPERLMHVVRVWPDGSEQHPTGLTFTFLRDHLAAFEHVAARRFSASGTAFATETRAEPIASATVSVDYFRVLGVEPILGRGFTAEEDTVGGPPRRHHQPRSVAAPLQR